MVLHPRRLSPVSSSGDPLTSESPTSSVSLEGVQPYLGLKLEAHRRWNTSLPLGFLWSVERVEINVTRADADNELMFVLEVFLSKPVSRLPIGKPGSNEERVTATFPTFKVERRFSDFEELRRSPRGLVKRFAGEQKRKQVLQTFINDFVSMGQRRVQKTGKRKCQAQQLVPELVSAFLLQGNVKA
ncbi:hypothetical protein PInf_001719 [Phytophthora infestans]|nr:hypothetical protein PInf_001719 [Phytophthora infestans]